MGPGEATARSVDGRAEAFVGRHDALVALRADWAAVAAGATRIVWVSGEPGMGKTALLGHFTAERDAAQVRWVSADEPEQRLRFGVAERVLHTLGAGAPIAAGAGELEVGAELIRALGALAGPTVLVVDDLHWADPPSLAALRFALRRLEHDRLLVVLVSRPESWAEPGEPIRRLLDNPRLVRRCRLDGLTPAEIVDLAGEIGVGRLDPHGADRLREHTAGNPLHVVALLRELGVERIAAGTVLPAPRSFANLVLARIAVLSEPARDLLEAGAVLGASFPIAAAARMASLDDPTPALHDATAAGILERGGPGLAGFTHQLIRAAIYDDLSPTARRDLHVAAAAVTSGREALQHRAGAVDGFDDQLADEFEVAAAAERASSNGAAGCDLLLAAARYSSAPECRDRRTITAVDVLLEHGQLQRAQALRTVVGACAVTPQRELVLALLDTSAGLFDAARARFEAALAAAELTAAELTAAEPGDIDASAAAAGDVRSRLLAGLAFVRWFGDDFEGAFDAVDEALCGDVGWDAPLASYMRVVSLVVLGRLDELRDNAATRLGAADRLAIEGTVRFHRYDLQGAVVALGDAVRQGRRGMSTKLFNVALGMLAEAEFRLGRWDDAAIHAELAVSLADATDEFIAVVPAHGSAAEIHAARGRFAASAEHIDRVSVFEAVMPGWAVRIRAAMAQAFLAIAKDDRVMLRSAGQVLLSEPIRSHVLARREAWQWRVMVTEAQLADGALEEATSTVTGLASEVGSLGLPNAVPDLARLTGALAEAQGRPQDALAAYSIEDAAVAAAQSPLAVARLVMARGEVQMRLGDRAAGIASLEVARTAFAALGAAPFLGRCDAALAVAGAVTTRDVGPTRLELSPRQEAVALLVADGMTNKEIASELFVSVKAIEYHLGQIYARTLLRSRRELGARMRAAAIHRG